MILYGERYIKAGCAPRGKGEERRHAVYGDRQLKRLADDARAAMMKATAAARKAESIISGAGGTEACAALTNAEIDAALAEAGIE